MCAHTCVLVFASYVRMREWREQRECIQVQVLHPTCRCSHASIMRTRAIRRVDLVSCVVREIVHWNIWGGALNTVGSQGTRVVHYKC